MPHSGPANATSTIARRFGGSSAKRVIDPNVGVGVCNDSDGSWTGGARLTPHLAAAIVCIASCISAVALSPAKRAKKIFPAAGSSFVSWVIQT
eukprot:scaffold7363_cov263-Pinguiococcus_pyrenoidosus.AAC.13